MGSPPCRMATRSRWDAFGSSSSGRGAEMEGTARPALPPISFGLIRPRARSRESGLLVIVIAAIVLGSVSLGATVAGPDDPAPFRPIDPQGLAIFVAALVA